MKGKRFLWQLYLDKEKRRVAQEMTCKRLFSWALTWGTVLYSQPFDHTLDLGRRVEEEGQQFLRELSHESYLVFHMIDSLIKKFPSRNCLLRASMSGRPLGRNCRWTLLTAETRTRSWKRSAVYKKRLQVHDQRFDEMVVGSVSRS